MRRKVIFLDRDGTLNVDHGYVHNKKNWEWIPCAQEALKRFQQAGYALAIITNQSGIAHGLYEERDMHALHEFMNAELEEKGIHIDALAFCPHGRDENNCDCRKPGIGMVRQIEEKLGKIHYRKSWTVGDKEADLGFGKKAGTNTALIRSRYWKEEELTEQPDIIVDSLQEAVEHIL